MSSVATGTDKPTYRHFIAGDPVDAADGATFDDLNPYTGEVVASVADGAREDARRAVEAAAAAEFTELKWVTVQSGTRPFAF